MFIARSGVFFNLVCVCCYIFRLLAPMERREGESSGELSQRLQESLRQELKLQQSQVTMENITEWLKGRKILQHLHVVPNTFH